MLIKGKNKVKNPNNHNPHSLINKVRRCHWIEYHNSPKYSNLQVLVSALNQQVLNKNLR